MKRVVKQLARVVGVETEVRREKRKKTKLDSSLKLRDWRKSRRRKKGERGWERGRFEKAGRDGRKKTKRN